MDDIFDTLEQEIREAAMREARKEFRHQVRAAIRNDYHAWIEDPRRSKSAEVDFGVWWRMEGQKWPTWRVSWIEDTGELYAKEQLPDSGRFIIIGTFRTREAVERFMQGWADKKPFLLHTPAGVLVNG